MYPGPGPNYGHPPNMRPTGPGMPNMYPPGPGINGRPNGPPGYHPLPYRDQGQNNQRPGPPNTNDKNSTKIEGQVKSETTQNLIATK